MADPVIPTPFTRTDYPVITSTTKPADAANQLAKYIVGIMQASLEAEGRLAESLPPAATTGNNEAQTFADKFIKAPNAIADVQINLPPAPTPDNLYIDFQGALNEVTAVVDGLQHSWLLQYFPASIPGGLDPLLTMIASGTIVTDSMQEIFWSRAKGQTQRDAARYEDEAVTAWAARGFALPGGVINKQIARKNQDLFNANADLAGQQAIKGLEIQIDAVKFAADVGTRLRLGLISGITGLVEAYTRLPTAAAEYASALANAKREAYAAIQEYYKTLLAVSEIKVNVSEKNIENQLRYAEIQASFIAGHTNSYIQAAVSATDVYARTAAAALAGVNNVTAIGIQSAV